VSSQRTETEVPLVPPYFDFLFTRLEAGDAGTTAAFGRHVHWGYWPRPEEADGTPEDYGRAAERMCTEVCNAAEIRDGLRVLDVGCGFGGTIAGLNERFRNLDLVGVNIDPRQLERARRTVHPQNNNRVRFIEGDACDLQMAPGSFDVVLAVECVFHFADRAAFFAGAARAAAPGGRLTLSDFVPPADMMTTMNLFWATPDREAKQSYGRIDFLWPLDRYRSLAAETGWELRHAENISRHTLPTYPFIRNAMRSWPDPDQARAFDRSTGRLEAACTMGMLDYSILTFEKVATSVEP
jgi:SAM-dependent methyltransferase